MINQIPEKVTDFNVYDEGEKLVGVSGEITLPNLESMSETISGAGIAGEYESPTPGYFGSITIEIPFRIIYNPSFKLMAPNGHTLTLRASQQHLDGGTGQLVNRGLKIVLKVIPKGLDLGTLAKAKPTESKNTLEVLYMKIEENGNTLLELDKLNHIFIVDGVDYLANVRQQI